MVGLPNYVDYLPIEPRMIFRIVNMEFGIFFLLKHAIFALAPCLRSILQPHTTQYKWLVKTINMIKLARYLKTMSTISNYMCIMSLCWMICNLHQKPCKAHWTGIKKCHLWAPKACSKLSKSTSQCVSPIGTTKGHFTHPPSAVTTKL